MNGTFSPAKQEDVVKFFAEIPVGRIGVTRELGYSYLRVDNEWLLQVNSSGWISLINVVRMHSPTLIDLQPEGSSITITT